LAKAAAHSFLVSHSHEAGEKINPDFDSIGAVCCLIFTSCIYIAVALFCSLPSLGEENLHGSGKRKVAFHPINWFACWRQNYLRLLTFVFAWNSFACFVRRNVYCPLQKLNKLSLCQIYILNHYRTISLEYIILYEAHMLKNMTN